jgi:hypothetical protein
MEGLSVAVKVQRNAASKEINGDIRNLKRLVELVDHLGVFLGFDLLNLIREYAVVVSGCWREGERERETARERYVRRRRTADSKVNSPSGSKGLLLCCVSNAPECVRLSIARRCTSEGAVLATVGRSRFRWSLTSPRRQPTFSTCSSSHTRRRRTPRWTVLWRGPCAIHRCTRRCARLACW